ncbi:MAG: ATP-binding cassette domain-containing protein [Chloroflexi bacterium]|nr:ATP-binding cassette domain-containing protein [Chloroflexota bacterium]
MSIVVAENLAKYYGAQDLFAQISFRIGHGDKVALVGANGVGKTTLLRIIAGLEAPTAGSFTMAKTLRLGYLSQKADLQSDRTLYEETLDVFADLRAQQERLHQLELDMADAERRDKAMEQYGELQHQFELAGGYAYEQRVKHVLLGLGFAQDDWHKPLAILSGGQRTRARLAQLLLQNPDLLLLDEPTNHLDLQATQWLEDYLQEWKGSLVVVAHDRYFLDRVANRVWEMSFGALEQYCGNYSQYSEQRAERQARRKVEYQAQQEQIAQTEDFIRRYKSGQRSREARGRQKRLDRLERLERPQEQSAMKFTLSTKVRGGNNVLTAHELQVGYDRPLIRCDDLLLLRGERAALLGPNGCGKTTFLKTVLQEVPALAGEVKIGANVRVAYLAQGHENLTEENTILEQILWVKNLELEQARGFLGRFLFSGDDVFKRIATLSGGERGRVALAMLALQGANFLLLDEPTNQLDIQSQELLERVLRDFQGTILFVSHDRYFIDALATQLWVVQSGQLRVYAGNYSDYQEQLRREQARTAEEPSARRRAAHLRSQVELEQQRLARIARQREAKRAELEAEIERLEARLTVLTHDLEIASRAQRVDRLYDLGREYADVQEQLQELLEEWAGMAQG